MTKNFLQLSLAEFKSATKPFCRRGGSSARSSLPMREASCQSSLVV